MNNTLVEMLSRKPGKLTTGLGGVGGGGGVHNGKVSIPEANLLDYIANNEKKKVT